MRPGDQCITKVVRQLECQPKRRAYQSRRRAGDQRQDRQDQWIAVRSFRWDGEVRFWVH
jgi:hypothetical protein